MKFEVHMYHPKAMANAVTPTSCFYTLYVHTPSSMVQKDNPSRLEIAFLLDSGASISVSNYPTHITLTKLLDIRPNNTSDLQPQHSSKTLTVANQTEVPILHYANIILNTTIDDNSRSFSVPFAVADIKYNILGTPFCEDSIQNINIQDFTLEFEYQSKIYPNYTKFTIQFINKFKFQFSDLTDTEYITLCNMLLKYKTCYATHKNDVGKISTPFRIRLKPNAQLITQRPSKVPIHYGDKLNNLLKELEKHNIIKQIGSSPQDKPVYGTTYLNLIIIPKGDTIKCVLDARHLNSNIEQSDESWLIEPLAPHLARANKKYKSAIDLMYAYAHSPLDEDTIKLTSFSSGDKLFAFIRGFYGLKGLPNFFTKQMSSFFKTIIEQGFALVYIDDILFLSDSKEHMFQLIEQLHIISTKNNLKLAPEKSFFMLLKVKLLGHEIGYNTIKPIQSKIAAIHKIPSPTGKVALMSFIGALSIYTKFIEKLHINLKPFYDLLHDNTPWKWTDEHEQIFQKLKKVSHF